MIKTYAEKLKDPRWQRKRLEILERDAWECVECGDSKSTLHVDHKIYRKSKQPWEYTSEELQTLCATCHKKIEDERSDLKERMSTFQHGSIEVMTGFAEGLLFLSRGYEPGHTVRLENYGQVEGFVAAVAAGDFPAFRGKRAIASVIGKLVNGKVAASSLMAIMDFDPTADT